MYLSEIDEYIEQAKYAKQTGRYTPIQYKERMNYLKEARKIAVKEQKILDKEYKKLTGL